LSVVEVSEAAEDGCHLALACSTVVSEGLAVKSFSPGIRRARLLALKNLAKRHPSKCLVCDRSGRCRLQTLCADLGLALVTRPNPEPVLTLVAPSPWGGGWPSLAQGQVPAKTRVLIRLIGAPPAGDGRPATGRGRAPRWPAGNRRKPPDKHK
jgi:hypothetical protein